MSRCGGVAVWGSCGVGELQCEGVAVWTDVRTDGLTDRWTDGRTDGWMDGQNGKKTTETNG